MARGQESLAGGWSWRDDRGRKVPRFSVGVIGAGGARFKAAGREIDQVLGRGLGSKLSGRDLLEYGVWIALTVAALMVSFALRLGAVETLGAFLGVGVGVGWVIFRLRLAREAERVKTVLMKHGLCPACGYEIDGLPVRSDGCKVCPECGSAWNRELIGQTRPKSG